MRELNCWEHKDCGRHEGGSKARELGVCPASAAQAADGFHGGHNGGHVCWAIAGTLWGTSVQGTLASKLSSCVTCDFYKAVMRQEGQGNAIAAVPSLQGLFICKTTVPSAPPRSRLWANGGRKM